MATILEKSQEILNEKNTKILPENLKKGVTAFGVEGTLESSSAPILEELTATENGSYLPDEGKDGFSKVNVNVPSTGGIDTSDADATEVDIVYPKTAYVNGEKIEGTLNEISENETVNMGMISTVDKISQPGTMVLQFTNSIIDTESVIRSGALGQVKVNNKTLAQFIDLTSDKLVKGNTILGIEGAAELNPIPQAGSIKLYSSEAEMKADIQTEEGIIGVVYNKKILNEIHINDTINGIQNKVDTISKAVVDNLISGSENQSNWRMRFVDGNVDMDISINSDQNISINYSYFVPNYPMKQSHLNLYYGYNTETESYNYQDMSNPENNTEIVPISMRLIPDRGNSTSGLAFSQEQLNAISEIVNFYTYELKGLYISSKMYEDYTDRICLNNIKTISDKDHINTDVFMDIDKIDPNFLYKPAYKENMSTEYAQQFYKTFIKTSEYIYVYYGAAFSWLNKGDEIVLGEQKSATIPKKVKKYNLAYELVEEYEIAPRTDEDIFHFFVSSWNETITITYYKAPELASIPVSDIWIAVTDLNDAPVFVDVETGGSYTYSSTEAAYMIKYRPLPTQYTLDNSNQLLNGITAYGKNGGVIGDYDPNSIASYTNPTVNKWTNYVLFTLSGVYRPINIDGYNFNVSIVSNIAYPTWNMDQKVRPNMMAIPQGFELQSMNVTMKLLDKKRRTNLAMYT